MEVRELFLIVTTLIVSSFGEHIRLEWSLGSPLPVSKMLNSGTEQDLYCSVNDHDNNYPTILQCPMYTGVCMENCNPHVDNLHIECTNMNQNNMIIYRYRIKVLKNYEGLWKCQYKSSISRTVELSVTSKPYISSFKAAPNPVWAGSQVNITCEVMPMPGISEIQFSRLLRDNTKAAIAGGDSRGPHPYSSSLIIPSVTLNKDEKFQCTVFTTTGESATKLLSVDIFYFPNSLRLVSTPAEDAFPVGVLVSFKCSAQGGNPRPVLALFRERIQEEKEKLIDTSVTLSKLDNGATFHCEIENAVGVRSPLRSNKIGIKVRYPPDDIDLSEESNGPLRESQFQIFHCRSKGGSEPQSEIRWSMTDSLGKKVPSIDLDKILERLPSDASRPKMLRNSIRITILRSLNEYTIACSVVYDNTILLTQKRIIKVEFSPNNIALNSNPIGSVVKGSSVVLTCATATANPPARIQWHKAKPGQKSEDATAHSNMDLMPANYSGVAISSSLSIYDVSEHDHGTIYKCAVSHAYISTEIVKEYVLNVLFPPIVKVLLYPQPVEEGDNVFLQCRTSGGNPSNAQLYRYKWQFCEVNSTYQLSSNSEFSERPSGNFTKSCLQTFHSSSFQLSQTLNISSVGSRQRGWYSCLVHTPGGSTVGYLFLNVLYQPILIKQIPDRLYAKESSDVVLKFEVLSNPLDVDVRWYFRPQQKSYSSPTNGQLFDNKVLPSTAIKKPIVTKPFGHHESIVYDNYTVCLLIRSITILDYGEYSCEVGNRLGKRWIQFQLFPSNDISIPESSISIQFSGRKVVVLFDPPSMGHFTHMVLRICPVDSTSHCRDMQVSSPLTGKASTTLHRSPASFNYRLLVYNGTTLLQMTNFIHKTIALQSGSWVEMSVEMMVAVIIGVAGIFVLLFVALVTLIFLKCKQNKTKSDLFVENNSLMTANSPQRQDYFLLNSSANTSLLKNGCHCFPNYPLELRSDNGSDHSAPSQGIYHPIMMRRKTRENGEMGSVHSGSSCRNPDVVLTEKTSVTSENNLNFNFAPNYNPIGGNNPTKVTFINGRLHSLDGQRQDLSLAEDYTRPPNIVFAAVDDGTNQTRLIPIGNNNLHSEYPLYYQMNNQISPKPYDSTSSPLYSTSIPHCLKTSETDNYRENSSSTNTDSNPYSGTQEPVVAEVDNNNSNDQ